MVTGRFSVYRKCDALHALCIINNIMYKLIKLEKNSEKKYICIIQLYKYIITIIIIIIFKNIF